MTNIRINNWWLNDKSPAVELSLSWVQSAQAIKIYFQTNQESIPEHLRGKVKNVGWSCRGTTNVVHFGRKWITRYYSHAENPFKTYSERVST